MKGKREANRGHLCSIPQLKIGAALSKSVKTLDGSNLEDK
jgi:hypothetical protein